MKLQITKCVLRIMYCFWCVYGKKHNQFFTDGECKTLKKIKTKAGSAHSISTCASCDLQRLVSTDDINKCNNFHQEQ